MSHSETSPALPDLSATAGVLGIAGAAWFAWSLAGQELPTIPVVVLAAVSLVVGVAGFLMRRKVSGVSVHAGNRAAYRTYNKALLFEVLAILVGNFALGQWGFGDYIPAWTMAMMGLHFFPLARLYDIRSLRILGITVLIISAVGTVIGLLDWAKPATVCCGLGAMAMLATAAWTLRTVIKRNTDVLQAAAR